MGFTVTRPGGMKDADLAAYSRVLRQQGQNLSSLPRTQDPENAKRRWVHVWDTEEEAQRFADELNEQTEAPGWRVMPTAVAPSTGPFGPVLIQLARRSDGLVLALHPLSRALIGEAYTGATPSASNTIIDEPTWTNFLKTRGSLKDLVDGTIPALTGLNMDQLTELGYAVIDADSDRTWVDVPPACALQLQA